MNASFPVSEIILHLLLTPFHFITFFPSLIPFAIPYHLTNPTVNNMASQQFTAANTISIRNLIDEVEPDPTRNNTPGYTQFLSNLTIVVEEYFFSPSITIQSIPAYIRTYIPKNDNDLYTSSTFIFADGRFYPSITDNILTLIVHTLTLTRFVCTTSAIYLILSQLEPNRKS